MDISMTKMGTKFKHEKVVSYVLSQINSDAMQIGEIKLYRGSTFRGSDYVSASTTIGDHHRTALFTYSRNSPSIVGIHNIVQYSTFQSDAFSATIQVLKSSDLFLFRTTNSKDCFLPMNLSEEERFQYSTVLPPKVMEFYDVICGIHEMLPEDSTFCTNYHALQYMEAYIDEFVRHQ